jgi:phage terminase small subunit
VTPKQRQFVAEYLVDLNATEAAKRAGYSHATAHSAGPRLLENVEVKAALEQAMTKREVRTLVRADRVLDEIGSIAFAKITDVVRWGVKEVAIGYDEDGKRLAPQDIGEAVVVHHEMAPYVEALNSDDLPDHVKAAVAEVALTKDGLRIKMHNKPEALTLAGRHLGMWNDKLDVSLVITLSPEERARRIAQLVEKHGADAG